MSDPSYTPERPRDISKDSDAYHKKTRERPTETSHQVGVPWTASGETETPLPERVIWTATRTADGQEYFYKYLLCETARTLPSGSIVFTAPETPGSLQREVSKASSSGDSIQIIDIRKPSRFSESPTSGGDAAAVIGKESSSRPDQPPDGKSPYFGSDRRKSRHSDSGFARHTSLDAGNIQRMSTGSNAAAKRKCNIPWKTKRMGPSETANIDIFGYRPEDYVERTVWHGESGTKASGSGAVEKRWSDSESDTETVQTGLQRSSGSQMTRKRPLQTNTCKVCQNYWRNEDEREPGQLLTKHVVPCKIHGHKRRPPNTPENYWTMKLTPPRNPYKAPVYEYEKRRAQKPP